VCWRWTGKEGGYGHDLCKWQLRISSLAAAFVALYAILQNLMPLHYAFAIYALAVLYDLIQSSPRSRSDLRIHVLSHMYWRCSSVALCNTSLQ